MRGWPVTLYEPRLLDAPVAPAARPGPGRAYLARDPGAERAVAAALGADQPGDPAVPVQPGPVRLDGPHDAPGGTARAGPAVGRDLRRRVCRAAHGRAASCGGRPGPAQVGYWIDEKFAGRGIIPTALAMAVDHCFRVVGLHRLEASIRPENHASRRVVEKLGFREEGLRRRQLHIDGAWRDHLCYALTVEEVPDRLMTRWRSIQMASRPTAS